MLQPDRPVGVTAAAADPAREELIGDLEGFTLDVKPDSRRIVLTHDGCERYRTSFPEKPTSAVALARVVAVALRHLSESCDAHAADAPAASDDLPGMWEAADLTGGETDVAADALAASEPDATS